MIKNLIKPIGSQSFLLGLGVAAAAYLIGPQLKQVIRPVAVKGAQGAMLLGGKTMEFVHHEKEKLDNMIFEKTGNQEKSQLAPMSESIQEKLLKDMKEEREISNKILEELKNSIIGLKEEISQMRNNNAVQ